MRTHCTHMTLGCPAYSVSRWSLRRAVICKTKSPLRSLCSANINTITLSFLRPSMFAQLCVLSSSPFVFVVHLLVGQFGHCLSSCLFHILLWGCSPVTATHSARPWSLSIFATSSHSVDYFNYLSLLLAHHVSSLAAIPHAKSVVLQRLGAYFLTISTRTVSASTPCAASWRDDELESSSCSLVSFER